MFTSEELSAINPKLPDDYAQKSKEFWDYIGEKLRSLTSVQKLYFDSLTTDQQEKALEFIKKNNEQCYNLFQRFIMSGAVMQATEDPILVQETASWISMLKDDKTSLATEEMLAKNMIDRDKFIAKKILESLNEGETGILFLSPERKITEYIPADRMRVIKIQPFDPTDYLNSWLVSESLKTQAKIQTS